MHGLVQAGRSPEELAREFEPSAQAIRNWVAQVDRDQGRRGDGLTSAERDDLDPIEHDERRLRWVLAGHRSELSKAGPIT